MILCTNELKNLLMCYSSNWRSGHCCIMMEARWKLWLACRRKQNNGRMMSNDEVISYRVVLKNMY